MKHHNIIRGSLLVAALLLMSAFVLMPVAAAATTVHLNPVDTTASPGTTGHIVDIVIDTTESVAGADIWLDYSSSVAEITAVTAVNFAGISYTPIATANTNDQMRINWADVSSPETGSNLVYARITFSAAGSAGYTDLDLSVNTMSDPGLGAISATAQDGSFTVTGTPVTIVRLNPVDTTASAGTTGHIVDIVIDTTESVAGADIWLDYSSSVAEITAVTAVNFAGISYTPIATANTNNQMRINWADAGSPKTGNGLVYARITFSAAGSAGYTDLDLTVTTMSDPGLGAISATAQDGSFTVTGTPVTIVRLNPVDTTASAGTTGHIVDIVIDTTESVAGADIWLDYSSSVAEITAVTAVNFAGISCTPIATANTNNQMRINWADAGSPKTGNGLVYARITFSAAGSAGYTDLDLTVTTMSDPGLGAISATAQDGSFTVTDLNTYYGDADGDGYGDPTNTTQATSAPAGYVTDDTDCDDTDADVNPGATEVCDDGIDNDCDGLTDCDDSDCMVDADNDGYYAEPCGNDCDDTRNDVYPGADELCDGVDNNCNGEIDEGCCPCDFCMPLEAGLNLVSVPRYVKVGGSDKASAVFNLSGIETCTRWRGCAGGWSTISPALLRVVPDRAYLVYKANAETLCLNETAYLGSQTLCADTWAMVGFPSRDTMTVAEFRTASSLGDDFTTVWLWNDGGWHSTEDMVPYRGYVLWMTEDGVMPGMIA